MIKTLIDIMQHKTQNIKVKINILHKIGQFFTFSFMLKRVLQMT